VKLTSIPPEIDLSTIAPDGGNGDDDGPSGSGGERTRPRVPLPAPSPEAAPQSIRRRSPNQLRPPHTHRSTRERKKSGGTPVLARKKTVASQPRNKGIIIQNMTKDHTTKAEGFAFARGIIMRAIPIILVSLFIAPAAFAEQPSIESLKARVEALERQVELLMIEQDAMKAKIAETAAAITELRGPIIISMDSNGQIISGMEAFQLEELTTRLKPILDKFPDQKLRITADPDTKYQDIIKVIDACRQAGGWNILFSTDEQVTEPNNKQPLPRSEPESEVDDKPKEE